MFQLKQTADVATADEPLTLNEARLHLRVIADPADVTPHPDDGLITALIPAARQSAEQTTGRKIGAQGFDLLLDAFPCAAGLVLPVSPVTSIASIKYYGADGDEQTLAVAGYQLDEGGLVQRLSLAPGAAWPSTQSRNQAVRISLVAGWAKADVPQAVKQWMLLLIGAMYENRAAEAAGAISKLGFVDGLLDPFRVRW